MRGVVDITDAATKALGFHGNVITHSAPRTKLGIRYKSVGARLDLMQRQCRSERFRSIATKRLKSIC